MDGFVKRKRYLIHDRDPQFLDHYHLERNHQGLKNQLITPMKGPVHTQGQIERKERLGGLLNYYYRVAA